MDDTGITARAFAEALGSEIAYWRKRRSMSREELAEKAGVSASTLGRIERDGPKDVSDTWNIADALDVPFIDLVRRAEEAAGMTQAGVGWPTVEVVPDLAEEDEAASAIDRLDRRARDTRPTRKRAMQQLDDQAARGEDTGA